MKPFTCLTAILTLLLFSVAVYAAPVMYINQVAFDAKGAKTAVIGTDEAVTSPITYSLVSTQTLKTVYTGKAGKALRMPDWDAGRYYYSIDFSSFHQAGHYCIRFRIGSKEYTSSTFQVAENALAQLTIPAILHYYNRQRANTPEELKADQQLLLYNSTNTVDLRGGWCDASGDISKYFSHLAYANFMSPQQIPMVTWSLTNTAEAIPKLLTSLGIKDAMEEEALWGADYLMRSLSAEGYFYMTVFSYFNKDPKARRVVGLEANSVTTTDYQCAFREGGGMAIAALARIARWQRNGAFTAKQYLDAAACAFDHLLLNNTKYCDDGKENIIDDYCALLAATELWITTGNQRYSEEARKRAQLLENRMTPAGYWRADDTGRPFWHAADAGLPVIALARYLKIETAVAERNKALTAIRQSLDYNLRVTNQVNNPFGYARQTFRHEGAIQNGFFIPHTNETGWWWQGENARLGSLAAAAIVGGRLVYPQTRGWGIKDSLATYASQQLSWILGSNPYAMCFLYQFGNNNVPYMHSLYGHGSEKGGISNGITGKEGNGDGSGIDFKTHANGNEWRWTEQWIPHAAWFLQAVTAMAAEPEQPTAFHVLALSETGGHHVAYSTAATTWLNQLALDSNFTIDYIHSTDQFTDAYLSQYQLFIQLDYVPYAWKDSAMTAFQRYITKGKGGWIGFHHATLLGDFDGYKIWPWFARFMGDIKFVNYIPGFANGQVHTENSSHPVMKGVPASFTIDKEEWYTYNKSPRHQVQVLASVDESTYTPASAVTMGDHPVIWTNNSYAARNVYIFMGHSPDLFHNEAYKTIFRNAIFWAAKKSGH